MSVTGTERRFLFVALADFNAVIRILKVEFGEYFSLAQAV
jgi:hypothetical protein